ncbi:MAG: dicarboxylate/amino acid:cation symporter [Myxococcales bacterium]|nr:dicarboxylate/amino acid:cation symporter [Myxococcales bacterium]HIK84662.1 dicarboxylate/amino acid:cation symporter [Myxococcales bacterium]
MSAVEPENAFGDTQLLTRRILIGLAAGMLLGVAINQAGRDLAIAQFLVDDLFYVVGEIFLRSLKLLVVPLVLVSLACGTAALEDVTKLGRIGGKTLALYMLTTAIAISLAILAAVIVGPGVGFDLPTEAIGYAAKGTPGFAQILIEIFPDNPFEAMSEGRMLQVIVFSVLLGVAMTLSGESGRGLLNLFESANAVIMKLVFMLMQIAPIGIFCLIAKVFANEGVDAFENLFKYFILVLAVLMVHAFVTYPVLLMLFGRLRPIGFFKKLRAPMSVAFGTASSGATLPVTLRTTEQRLGVDPSIASFTVPLGATINMDGTAIMQGVATVFIAQAYGIDIGPAGYLTIVLTATLASVGTAGVPGVGTIMLAMVLRQMDLPVEGIGLILGVDRLLDMTRTAVNITGDAAVSCIVARSEGKLDLETFNGP